MCTASWWFSQDGSYELFFNRDEQKTRRLAEAPKVYHAGHLSFIAPLDTDRGGSWIAVNDLGLTVCLLNHYPQNGVSCLRATGTSTTRGRLVLDSATATNLASVTALLEQKPLDQFAPFYLLALSLGGERLLHIWNGETLERITAGLDAPLTTSSYETEAVARERRHKYSWLITTLGVNERPPLEPFHNQHDPSRGPYSVLMNRPDACTVSQTIVRVGPAKLSVTYRPITWSAAGAQYDVVESELPLRHTTALAL